MNPHWLPALLAALASCLSSPTSAGGTSGKKYTYTNLSVRDGACGMFEGGLPAAAKPAAVKTVIDTNPESRYGQLHGTYVTCDSLATLLECEAETYYCFRTSAMHFAVPKRSGMHIGQRWTSMDDTFEVVGTEEMAYLGKRLKAFVIATPNKQNGTNYFYWSDRDGLVAMRFLMRVDGKEFVNAIVAEDARGFPL